MLLKYNKALVLLLLLCGCTITLISTYDEVIDAGITDFQKRMDLFLMQRQRLPASAFDPAFYENTFADLQSLHTRAAAVPNNTQTSTIIELLATQVQLIKTTDSSGAGSRAFFTGAQMTIDQNCQNALKLELAKKRGD